MKWLDFSWFRPAPAARLGVVRVLVGSFAFAYVTARLGYFGSYAAFSPGQFAPVGVVAALERPLPAGVVWLLAIVTPLAALAFALGWRYRITGPLFALLLLWTLTYRSSWGMIFHTENLLVLHVLILAIVPAADAWSLDARKRAARAAESSAYGWPLRLMAAVVVATYLLAGIAKLRLSGGDWASGEILRNYVATDALRKILLGSTHSPLSARLIGQEWLFGGLAYFTLALELGAPLALFVPRLAPIWAVAALGFHAGVVALMAIFFPYAGIGFAFAPMFAMERPANWLQARWQATRGRVARPLSG
jgi:hypothetical protein